ncbi:MAG: SynChlorMet cassette protein ScmC [Deltaproteobacteria bacterium]|nr:SynChlorMet cassette protein ScmC [Deltaproteobacteria bacterium]
MSTFGADRYDLKLADGSRWSISAGDPQSVSIVSQFGEAMQLSRSDYSASPVSSHLKTGKSLPVPSSDGTFGHRLLVLVDGEDSRAFLPRLHPLKSFGDQGTVVCRLGHWDSETERFVHLVQISLVLARQAQTCGGILLHGALADWNGLGVILAGPGGTGKTTASNRLPAPWRSLSDDLTLIVRDSQKNYWAHPWPTWSRFLWGGPGGEWNVQKAVPLGGIFFLLRADEDQVAPLGNGQAISLLLSSTREASNLMARGLSPEESQALHLKWFNNLYSLSRSVSPHLLHISLTGPFWKEIERVLEKNCREG